MSRLSSRRQFIRGGACVAALGTVGLALPTAAGALPAGQPQTDKYSASLLTDWMRTVFDQVKAERFTPTAAARAYAHVALAAYEAVVGGMPQHRSLSGQLNGLGVHRTKPGYHWAVAMNEAVAVAAQAVFADKSAASRSALAAYATTTAATISTDVPASIVRRSAEYGRGIGESVAARSRLDNYAETRGLPYTPPIGPDKWERTPPNFGSALEPHWGQILSFALTSNNECKPPAPVAFSEVSGSEFWNQAKTTYDTVNQLDDTRRATALFWRDNPDGTSGLPAGHWTLITCQLIEQQERNLAEAAEIMVLVGLALADGFTSCWTEKYETNLIRPVTYIRRVIDPTWASFVNSPAFPEYTSGHSVGSAAAAETLTSLFGPVAFTDATGAVNGFPPIQYASVWEAANEAAISRLYGGIHYPMGIEAGLDQGRAVARKVLSRARTRV